MAELKEEYDSKLSQKEELRRKAEQTEIMLDRAGKLVSGNHTVHIPDLEIDYLLSFDDHHGRLHIFSSSMNILTSVIIGQNNITQTRLPLHLIIQYVLNKVIYCVLSNSP